MGEFNGEFIFVYLKEFDSHLGLESDFNFFLLLILFFSFLNLIFLRNCHTTFNVDGHLPFTGVLFNVVFANILILV